MTANQIGKIIPMDTTVATPDGWTFINKLNIGDKVIGGDGKSCNVIGVFPQGNILNYRVRFDDDSSVLVGGEHLWKALKPTRRWKRHWDSRDKKYRDNKKYRVWEDLNTKQIIKLGGLKPKNTRKCVIPSVRPVEFNEKKLPIDPYTLGVLLGDGSLGDVISVSTKDKEILGWVVFGGEIKYTSGFDYNLVYPHEIDKESGRFVKSNKLKQYIEDLGLKNTKSYNKFVPSIYLESSVEQRLALLQGLMDTDGTAGKKTGCIEFSTVSEQLAKNVQNLFRSFGMKCKIFERYTSFTYGGEKKRGRKSYRVRPRWNGLKVFRLERKNSRCKIPQRTCEDLLVTKIKKTGKFKSVCIRVDSSDQTYVTDEFIVTHGTQGSEADIPHIQ